MKKQLLLALVVLLILPCSSLVVAGGKAANWHVPGDFDTIQEAIDSPMVMDGDTILVGPGTFAGALVDKQVNIVGKGRAVIDDGPLHGSGLIQGFRLLDGSHGASLSHLTFETDLAIMNGDGVDNVTVTHNAFYDAIQAISDWRGSAWIITHNEIIDLRTRCGGGIGILVADFSGGDVVANLVDHNTIQGTLQVSEGDCGGYNGSGIVLYADFRWGALGAAAIELNRVTHNRVGMTSDTPDVVDIVAFELTDTRDDPTADPVIFDNSIGFNDFRRTTLQTALTPMELEDENVISRNLGNNRGHGVHPSKIFQPGS